MRNETNSARHASMKKYLLASWTSFLLERFTSRDWQKGRIIKGLLSVKRDYNIYPYLDQSRMEVYVMRHDDGSDDPNSLSQLDVPTALTVWNKHPLQQVRLVWTHCHILENREETLYGTTIRSFIPQNLITPRTTVLLPISSVSDWSTGPRFSFRKMALSGVQLLGSCWGQCESDDVMWPLCWTLLVNRITIRTVIAVKLRLNDHIWSCYWKNETADTGSWNVFPQGWWQDSDLVPGWRDIFPNASDEGMYLEVFKVCSRAAFLPQYMQHREKEEKATEGLSVMLSYWYVNVQVWLLIRISSWSRITVPLFPRDPTVLFRSGCLLGVLLRLWWTKTSL